MSEIYNSAPILTEVFGQNSGQARESLTASNPEQLKLAQQIAGRMEEALALAGSEEAHQRSSGMTRLAGLGMRLDQTVALAGPENGTRIVDALLNGLKDTDAGVRASAASTVATSKNQVFLPPLVDLTNDDDNFARRMAYRALGGVGGESVLPILQEALKTESDSKVLESVTEGLGNSNTSRAAPVLLAVMTSQSTNFDVRAAAAKALGNVADPADNNIMAELRGASEYLPGAGAKYARDSLRQVKERSYMRSSEDENGNLVVSYTRSSPPTANPV